MKKFRCMIIVISLVLVLLSACRVNESPSDDEKPQSTPTPTPIATEAQGKVSDYFVFNRNVIMKYQGTGNEYAPFDTYVDYIKDNLVQIRSITDGTTVANVYQFIDGAVKLVFAKEEVYYRYDYTGEKNRDEIIIKEPIQVGTSWVLSDERNRSITSVNKVVNTPAGNFEAIEITTQGKDYVTRDYYVKDVGFVKSEFSSGDNTDLVIRELEEIREDVSYKNLVRLFFPHFENQEVVLIEKEIGLFTDESISSKFQEEFVKAVENTDLTPLISKDTKILGYEINEDEGIIKVNFSKHLIDDMNAGAALESMILRSIVNTFGDYFQKNKVIITTDGKLYESGHILLEEGDYFETNFK